MVRTYLSSFYFRANYIRGILEKAKSKVKAKKIAAYMVIVHLFESAGISDEIWKSIIWQNMEQ